MRFKDKVVLVTGGAQGIGRAICQDFAKEGAKILIADIDEEAGKELEAKLNKTPGTSLFVKTDAASEDDIIKAFNICKENFNTVDILVNNAGIGTPGGMLHSTTESFDRVLAVNLRGTYLCSREAAKIMRPDNNCVIINMASTRAFMSEADTEAYSASKGGIIALTHSMAISLGNRGIRVNSISPGWIETCTHQKASIAHEPNHTDVDRLQHPVKRVGIPEDISKACLFLASEEAGFITGTNLTVDGGMTIKMIYV
jgi:NAD(P)-dependent dehydrogenase (short-subunit alcohol dehydrogenase family)